MALQLKALFLEEDLGLDPNTHTEAQKWVELHF